ncbi:23S rRNA pseudouridine(955/2504/2580) synthase RluC [Methylophaga thalassica]|uniref:23S rRNA pseudouridine(955/2504/2580) synthase RluC n=1 Tax=Methylophaga thalassica TaxID=40223 RepID=UPI002E7C3466|nr:23S rRNA pseudouridine(955/2504/2580) synthase RluC [Methylophaga thalassica]WVI84842.1 23S rRNA pseudouridine(955/2504/2580) synthase RluC [Methylophaga thalassica]
MAAHKPQSQKVQFIEISASQAGQRIDNFLLTLEKGVPKSRIYRAIRKGEVRVNKGRIKQTYKIEAGDVIRVPPLQVSEKTAPTEINESLQQQLLASIIFEDDAMLVLNKPSGLAVHAGTQIQVGVIEAFRLIKPELEFIELVHRLDRDTSGCLLIAKSRESLLNLQQQMLSDKIDKRYLTLLKDEMNSDEVYVEQPLQKNTVSSGERMVKVDPEGKSAKTLFIKRQSYGIAQLSEVKLFTGRTHQIRVHSAWSGHPVAGDDKYGDREFNKQMKTFGLKRLFLHAWQLGIHHPITQEPLSLEAPLPEKLQQVIKQLEQA